MLICAAGLLIPILLVLYGLTSIIRGEALVIGYGKLFSLYGTDATVYGVASLALAGLLHCAAFWDSLRGSTPACARAKLLCLGTMGICAYVLCGRMLPGLWS